MLGWLKVQVKTLRNHLTFGNWRKIKLNCKKKKKTQIHRNHEEHLIQAIPFKSQMIRTEFPLCFGVFFPPNVIYLKSFFFTSFFNKDFSLYSPKKKS